MGILACTSPRPRWSQSLCLFRSVLYSISIGLSEIQSVARSSLELRHSPLFWATLNAPSGNATPALRQSATRPEKTRLTAQNYLGFALASPRLLLLLLLLLLMLVLLLPPPWPPPLPSCPTFT